MISTKNTVRSTSRVWVPKNGHEGVVKIFSKRMTTTSTSLMMAAKHHSAGMFAEATQ